MLISDFRSYFFFPDASPNELIIHLNILKMCLLSAMTVVFLLEGRCEQTTQRELQEAVKKINNNNLCNLALYSSRTFLRAGKMMSDM